MVLRGVLLVIRILMVSCVYSRDFTGIYTCTIANGSSFTSYIAIPLHTQIQSLTGLHHSSHFTYYSSLGSYTLPVPLLPVPADRLPVYFFSSSFKDGSSCKSSYSLLFFVCTYIHTYTTHPSTHFTYHTPPLLRSHFPLSQIYISRPVTRLL